MSNENEPVMYLVFRGDLKLTKGKVAAQAGHAVQLILTKLGNEIGFTSDEGAKWSKWYMEWQGASYAKVAVKVDSWTAFTDLCANLYLDEVPYAVVTDEGRTNVPPNTITCLAIAPMPRSEAAKYVGNLKLY